MIVANPVMHSKMKHVQIDHHFVREKLVQGSLLLRYLPSADQLVDAMTKALPSNRFLSLRTKLTVLPRPMNLRGMLDN